MYRLCNVNHVEFWDFTPAETRSMLDIAYDHLKYDSIKHAEILMWIANSQHIQRKDKKLFTLDEFLPEFAKDSKSQELSVEELERLWWNEAI